MQKDTGTRARVAWHADPKGGPRLNKWDTIDGMNPHHDFSGPGFHSHKEDRLYRTTTFYHVAAICAKHNVERFSTKDLARAFSALVLRPDNAPRNCIFWRWRGHGCGVTHWRPCSVATPRPRRSTATLWASSPSSPSSSTGQSRLQPGGMSRSLATETLTTFRGSFPRPLPSAPLSSRAPSRRSPPGRTSPSPIPSPSSTSTAHGAMDSCGWLGPSPPRTRRSSQSASVSTTLGVTRSRSTSSARPGASPPTKRRRR